jgi:hypothetical protein
MTLTIETIKTYENKTIQDSETGETKTYSLCCPFMTQQERRQWMSENCVALWGDQMYDAHMEMLRNETPQEREARLKKEAAADEKSHNGLETFSVKRKEDKWCSKSGEMKFRVPKPCKYASLFAQRICAAPTCGKKVPEGQAKCSCGEILAGCWNHEKTHTCIYVHPDEPQWEAACSGELCFDRQQQLFHLRTEPLAAPNRFIAMAKNAKEEPQRSARPSGHSGKVYESSRFAEKPRARKTEVETAW